MLVRQGSPSGDYWIGLEALHQLTTSGRYKLRVDMQALNGTWFWEEYAGFSVGGAASNYTLTVTGYSADDMKGAACAASVG